MKVGWTDGIEEVADRVSEGEESREGLPVATTERGTRGEPRGLKLPLGMAPRSDLGEDWAEECNGLEP